MTNQGKPIYEQLADGIKLKILNNVWKIGDKIPSERDMAETYGIARMTVHKALIKLQKEGILSSEHGKGTFVIRRPEEIKKVELGAGSSSRLSLDIRSGGMTPSRVVLSMKKKLPEGNLADCFPQAEYVIELIRLMLIDEKPYAVQVASLPYHLFEDALRYNFKNCSLYEYMDSKGHYPKEIVSELKVEIIPEEYAPILKIPVGKNVFLFEYFGYDMEGILVEYTRSYNLPEYTAFKYVTKRY